MDNTTEEKKDPGTEGITPAVEETVSAPASEEKAVSAEHETAPHHKRASHPRKKRSLKIPSFVNPRNAVILGAIIALGGFLYYMKGTFIAATVDGAPISRLSVVRELEKQSGKSTLDALIVERLVENAAKAQGATATSEEVESQIQEIRTQIESQGETLEAALEAEGMTLTELQKQIGIQKALEKLLVDKITVTDEEVTQYIAENELEVPEGEEATFPTQVKDYLIQQKFSSEVDIYIESLRSQAKISYFVNY